MDKTFEDGASEDFAVDSKPVILPRESVRKVLDESPTLRKAYARWAHLHPKALVIPLTGDYEVH